MLKKTLIFVCAAFLVGAMAICAHASEPYRIGALLPITGPASFLGEPQRKTADMVIDLINKAGGINGRPLELVLYDTEGNETKSVIAARRIASRDNVLAIIGPGTTGPSLAIIPIINEAQIPMISLGSSMKIGAPVEERKWIFKVVPGDDLAVALMYGYMKEQGIERVAIMSVSTGYGIGGRETLQNLAPQFGIQIVSDDTYGPQEADLTAQLTKIRGTNAQAIINWSIGPPQIVVTRNWKQLGMTIPMYQSYGFGSKRNIELSGGAAEGVICPVSRIVIADALNENDPQTPVVRKYKELYEQRYKEEVSVFGGHAWDALYQIAEAIAAVGADRAKIRDYLENNIVNFIGNNGVFNRSAADHVGLALDSYVMVQVKDGDWSVLK
jgi:branched-chain amino acid transport system substrate-binding protein